LNAESTKTSGAISPLTPLGTPAGIFYTAFAVIYSGLLVAIPILLGNLIDTLIAGNPPYREFILLASVAFTAATLDWALKRTIRRISRDWEQTLQMRLLNAFRSLPPERSDRFPPGEAALKFFRDALTLGEFLRSFYPQLLGAVCAAVLAIAVAVHKSRLVTLLFALCVPLLPLPSIFWRKLFRRLRHALRRFNDSAMNKVFECMHILPYLKSLAADLPYTLHTRDRLDRYCALNLKHDRAEVDFEGANRGMLLLGEYTILAVSCTLAYRKLIPVGDVVVFQALFLSVLNSLGGVFKLLPNLTNVHESCDSVNELLTSVEAEDIDGGTVIHSASGDIVADNVTFSYRDGKRKILHDFSCVIPSGSIVGVTGENGAGKTTLLKLLSGYLFPTHGTVRVDGVDLCRLNLRAFRERVASVFQDSLLVTGTLKDNITLCDPRYGTRDIRQALELSGADSLAARMPDGLAHRINFNDGGGLSGGERQKLAIARALIRRPDILIFDEVTNHLDYESRLRMRDLLTRLRGRTTVLLVSHDPELIKLCDMEIRLSMEL